MKKDLIVYIVGGVIVFWLTDGILQYSQEKTRPMRIENGTENTMPSETSGEDKAIFSRSSTEEKSEEDKLPTSSSLNPLNGTWDLTVTTDSRVYDSRETEDLDATIHWVISLRTSGNDVEGDLIASISDDIGGLCDQGSIEGKMDGDDVQLNLTFAGKDCCYLEESSYTLRFAGPNNLRGAVRPKKTPTGSCSLWSGEVTGVKRS
jgi:hypothetical protein